MTMPPCTACGWMPKPRAREIQIVDGELGLIQGGRVKPHDYDPVERERWHSMLTYIQRERGYKPGWVAHQYKQKFGSYPLWGGVALPIAPTPEVRSWVRSRMIAYAKRQAVA
jgi:hypothetical protein